jgi:hypothetical protein
MAFHVSTVAMSAKFVEPVASLIPEPKQNGLSAGGILRPLETSRRALGQNVDRSVAWLAEIEISDR